MIYWFTGQPGTGKTTLAAAWAIYLRGIGNPVAHIDGDTLRAMTGNTDYTRDGRRRNVVLAQQLASLFAYEGMDVCVSMVSPDRDVRERFKQRGGVREIFLQCDPPHCKAEFKCVEYAKPIGGRDEFLLLDTNAISVSECLNMMIHLLQPPA